MKISARIIPLAVLVVLAPVALVLPFSSWAQSSPSPQFAISFSKQKSEKPLDGRMLLLLSTDPSEEPRMQINDTPQCHRTGNGWSRSTLLRFYRELWRHGSPGDAVREYLERTGVWSLDACDRC